MSKEHIFLTYCSENKSIIDQIENDITPYGITTTHDLRVESDLDKTRKVMKESGDPVFLFISNDFVCSSEGMHKLSSFINDSKVQLKPVLIGELAEDQAYADYWEQEYQNLRARKDNIPPAEKDTYNWRVFIVRKIRDNAAKVVAELKQLNYIRLETLQESNYHEVFNALGIEVRLVEETEATVDSSDTPIEVAPIADIPIEEPVKTVEAVEQVSSTIKDDIIRVGSVATAGGVVNKISESLGATETPVVETPTLEVPEIETPTIDVPVEETVAETSVVEAIETTTNEAEDIINPIAKMPVEEQDTFVEDEFVDDDEDEDDEEITMVKVKSNRATEGGSLDKARREKRHRKSSKWKGTNVLITGATSGIGLAIAKRFAKKGFDLIITGRRQHRLEEIKHNLEKKYGNHVEMIEFDVQNKSQVDKAVKTLKSKKLEVDILINNAGLAKGLDYFHESSIDHWETMIDTNLKGLLYVTRSIAPLMVKRGKGHIINIGSIAGREVYPKGAVYCATKHAVEAITKSIRMDLMPHGIKVSSVSPGHVETEFSMVRFDGDLKKADAMYDGFEPLKADDVARTVIFIATQPANVNIQDVLMFSSDQASATQINRKNGK